MNCHRRLKRLALQASWNKDRVQSDLDFLDESFVRLGNIGSILTSVVERHAKDAKAMLTITMVKMAMENKQLDMLEGPREQDFGRTIPRPHSR
jgi:hypothetical protein